MKLPPPQRPAPARPSAEKPRAPDRQAPPRPGIGADAGVSLSEGAGAALDDDPPPPPPEDPPEVPAPGDPEPLSMQQAVSLRYPAVRSAEQAQSLPVARAKLAPAGTRAAAQQAPAAVKPELPTTPAARNALAFGGQAFIWQGQPVVPQATFLKHSTDRGIEWGFTFDEGSTDDEGQTARSDQTLGRQLRELASTPNHQAVIMCVKPENVEKFRSRVGEWVGAPKGTSLNGVLLALSTKSTNRATWEQYNIPALCAVLDRRSMLAGRVPYEGSTEL